MTDPTLVSVLIRSMDRPTLQRALDSVAAQDYPNIEVVVVSAGGPTHRDLPERCGAFPLRLIRPPAALARAEAGNVVIEAARGEWFNFLDDDDELLPMHVSRLRAALDANPEVGLVHSICEDVSVDGNHIGYYGARFKPWRQLDTGFFRSVSAMFSHLMLDEGVAFDPHFEILEDMDFFIQCAQRSPFDFVPEVTARYYADAGDSGAGFGGNRNNARLEGALKTLHEKWIELDRLARASAQFRTEQALWLIENGEFPQAAPIVATLLAENPTSADARTLRVLQHIARGEPERAQHIMGLIGDSTPSLEAVALKLDQLRARMGTRH